LRAVFERLPRDPQRIDFAVELRAELREFQRRRVPRDEESRAAARGDQPFGGEAVVGVDDRRFRDARARRHLPYRRQARAGRERAPRNAFADRAHHRADTRGVVVLRAFHRGAH
jgi:hypothetical protein